MGTIPPVLRSARTVAAPNRRARRSLSPCLGRRPGGHGRALRSNRPEGADCRGASRPGAFARGDRPRPGLCHLGRGSDRIGCWHGHGLSGAARGSRRRGPSGVASVGCRCLSALARCRIRRRRAALRRHRGRLWVGRGDLGSGRRHRGRGSHRRGQDVRDAPSSRRTGEPSGITRVMRATASRWALRAVDLAAKPGGRDNDRLASGLFLLVTASGAAAGLLWGIAYALLGRPLSGAVPAAFAVVAALVAMRVARSRELGRLREFMLLLILLLPAVLQASLGGYVKGSAVIAWSFFAPLSALVFFGPWAGWAWLAGFVAVTGLSALVDPPLARSVPPLPYAAQTALFVFNLCGVAGIVTPVLAYFRIQRG